MSSMQAKGEQYNGSTVYIQDTVGGMSQLNKVHKVSLE